MEGASKETIAVWFSSGAASAVAAKKALWRTQVIYDLYKDNKDA